MRRIRARAQFERAARIPVVRSVVSNCSWATLLVVVVPIQRPAQPLSADVQTKDYVVSYGISMAIKILSGSLKVPKELSARRWFFVLHCGYILPEDSH